MYKKSFILWSIGVLLFTTVNTVSITRESKEAGELELSYKKNKINFSRCVSTEFCSP